MEVCSRLATIFDFFHSFSSSLLPLSYPLMHTPLSIGLFFLLAAAKEGETVMKDFFTQNVEKADAAQQRKAVLRFKALWKCRYKVWPAVGEMGQKKFNSEREGEERQVRS